MHILVRAALALFLLLPAAAVAQEVETSFSALVRISGTRDGTLARGSGFVVGLDGDKATIVTASHVIEGMQQLEVGFAADLVESFSAGAVLGMETGNPRGLAVFQVRGALPGGVTTLVLEVESQPRVGEALFLLGFPQMAPKPHMTQRVLSGRDGQLLLVDQGLGEGFSGGPVLQGGKVVGVITDTDDQTTYAVNAVVVRAALEGWAVKLAATKPATKPALPEAKPCSGEERTAAGIVFVRICAGIFIMGSAEADRKASIVETPAHSVKLSEFWIGKTEISNEQYRRFQPDYRGEANLPATDVRWADAKAACEFFGGRLPTEAEWEYAARAGSQTVWSFGDDENLLDEYAWYKKNSSNKPHPVGMKKPNSWGLHDMYGNVWEWVADWFDEYSRMAQIDPLGPKAGEDRVRRGGSFYDEARDLRSARRFVASPIDRNWNIGFRCVLAAASFSP